MKEVKRKIDSKSLKRISAIPLLACAVVASIWSVAMVKNFSLTENAESAAVKRLHAFNQTLALYDERLLRSRDMTARTIGFLYSQHVDASLLHGFVNNVLPFSGTRSSFLIADPSGDIVLPKQKTPTSIKDRPYFPYHAQNKGGEPYINSPVISRVTNRPVVSVTRRITNTHGDFDGIVSVGVSPEEFLPSGEQSTLGNNSFMAVVGTDEIYRAYRLGGGRVSIGNIVIPGISAKTSGQAVVPETHFPDNKKRLVVWDKIPGFPLYAVSGVDLSEEMASALGQQDDNNRTAAYFSILIGTSAFAATIALAIFERRRRKQDATQHAYRNAVEGSHDGFFVLEAIRDNHGNIIDFVCIDSNAQAATMIGHPDKSMLNMKLTDIFEGDFGQKLTNGYAKIMNRNETVNKASVYMPYEFALKNKWLDYRVVPYENGVTVTILDVTAEKANSEKAAWQKLHDVVTNLPNRLAFQKAMPDIIHNASEKQAHVALFLIDIDDFKIVNDTFGYSQGDTLLKMISERLSQIIRSHDLLYRIGADEFAITMAGNLTPSVLNDFASRIIQKLSQPYFLEDKTIRVSASIGISSYPEQGTDATQLLQYADLAMNSAKEAGKNTYKFFEESLYAQADRRMSLEQDLRLAVEREELFLLYQPKIDLASQKIVGMEALIRWKSPTRGLVSPLEFISIAEKTGLILPIGNFVIEQACRQIVAWQEEGRIALPVSVNISPKQLRKGDLVDIIKAALEKYKIPAYLLQIELTESSMMDDVTSSQKQMQAIKGLGVKILIDDFGTGYSSLALLKKFEVDVLKVDRSFVMDIPGDPDDCAILQAIVSMANALRMEVVAEGVETAEQVTFLTQQGCEACQGYHYSKPISAEEITSWLERA